MTRRLAFLALASVIGCGGTSTPSATPSRETAVAATPATALAETVREAVGGSLRGVARLRFDFVVMAGETRQFVASHDWDLRAHTDHVLWTSRDGQHFDVTVDLESRAGSGTVDSTPLEGDALTERLQKAYGRWVNDSYWLLMPLKVRDPGVILTLDSPRDWQGRTYDVLSLEFDHVGLTPGDHYWLFVNRDTHLVDRWEMVLEGEAPPPSGTTWARWTDFGRLKLPLEHVADDGQQAINFENVEVVYEESR